MRALVGDFYFARERAAAEFGGCLRQFDAGVADEQASFCGKRPVGLDIDGGT